MAFHEQSFSTRFGAMGDQAEAVFEQVYEGGFERFGLNRPNLHMPSLPERIRHMPDYLTSRGFVECKGIGNDDIIKIKVGEFNCMNFWNEVFPLRIFVWSSKRKKYTIMALTEVRRLIDNKHTTLGYFHDGKAYFALEGDSFAWATLEDPLQ